VDFAKLHSQRQRAQQVQEDYNRRVVEVRSNPDLSDDGRQRQLAALYQDTRGELNKYAEAEREQLTTRRADLERELFGARKSMGMDAATLAISTRDAADRASQISSAADAQRLLAQAEATGDDILARAVARVSVQRSDSGIRSHNEAWEGVLRSYLETRPGLMSTVEELAEIESLSAPRVFSPFAVAPPADVPNRYLNAAKAGREPEPPPRLTTGPLRNPATTTTTREERADWAAAQKAEQT
jgi:hypothetical protein